MSDISRRDLLMSAESMKMDEETKLKMKVEEMYFLKAVMELKGWKEIVAPYINNKLSMDRFLQTTTAQQRNEVWGALTELNDFVSFLRKKIQEGEAAAKALNKREEK